jgi:hypothetical protein
MPTDISLADQLRVRKAQWDAANEYLEAEARGRTLDERVRQFGILFKTARKLGWTERMREGEEEVWARWQAVREALNGRRATG